MVRGESGRTRRRAGYSGARHRSDRDRPRAGRSRSCSARPRADQLISRLDLEIGEVTADQWALVVASEDRVRHRLVIRRAGVAALILADIGAAWAIFVASSTAAPGGLNLPGLALTTSRSTTWRCRCWRRARCCPRRIGYCRGSGGRSQGAQLPRGPAAWAAGSASAHAAAGLIGAGPGVSPTVLLDSNKGNGSPRTAMNLLRL